MSQTTFWNLLKENKIEIPIIQRDYAQGREGKEYLRQTFLESLKKALDENKVLKLDFVYGSTENGALQPLDGQQRLTTLWILHWYIAMRAGKLHEAGAALKKFTYETRISSREFCEELCNASNFDSYVKYCNGCKPLEKCPRKSIVDFITSQTWFYSSWKQDPTIQSMLRMLGGTQKKGKGGTDIPDGIEEVFGESSDFEKYWDKLESDNAPVVFYYLPLKDFGLSDDLYIKMNGRGKPLTAFENLKAAIDNILPEESNYDFKEMGDEAGDSNFKKNWQSCIDGKWTDAFWDKEKPHDIDKNLTKFIVRFLSGCYAALKPNGDQTADDETKKQLGEINANEDNYSSFIPFAPIKKVLELENSFGFLARAFDIISCKKEVLYPTWRNSDFTFTIDVITEYKTLSVLLAYVLFDGDKKALRFTWNMAENTVSGYDNFISLCRRFGQIKNHSKIREGIYNVLSEIEFDNPSEQLKEEIAKAKQILKGNYDGNIDELKGRTWEDAIIEAENYAFFKGAIRFLFRNENGEWDWKDFDTKWRNVQKYFDKDGVCDSSEINYKTDVIVLKAVLYHVNDFEDKIQPQKFVLDNKSDTWKNNILLPYDWANAVHQVLMGNLKVKERVSDCYLYKSLYSTNCDLLDFVANKQVNSRIKWIYGRRAIYPPRYQGIMPDDEYPSGCFYRNNVLCELYCEDSDAEKMKEEKIYSNQKIKDYNLFWGWNIHFKYKKDQKIYNFRWQYNNKIEMYEGNKRLANDEKYKDLTISGENITDKNSLIQSLNACIEKYEKLQSEQPTS